jgi:hypothetical protein
LRTTFGSLLAFAATFAAPAWAETTLVCDVQTAYSQIQAEYSVDEPNNNVRLLHYSVISPQEVTIDNVQFTAGYVSFVEEWASAVDSNGNLVPAFSRRVTIDRTTLAINRAGWTGMCRIPHAQF